MFCLVVIKTAGQTISAQIRNSLSAQKTMDLSHAAILKQSSARDSDFME